MQSKARTTGKARGLPSPYPSLRRWYDRSFRWREGGQGCQVDNAPSARSRPASAASISAIVSGMP